MDDQWVPSLLPQLIAWYWLHKILKLVSPRGEYAKDNQVKFSAILLGKGMESETELYKIFLAHTPS